MKVRRNEIAKKNKDGKEGDKQAICCGVNGLIFMQYAYCTILQCAGYFDF
jgi:hypothetical protein